MRSQRFVLVEQVRVEFLQHGQYLVQHQIGPSQPYANQKSGIILIQKRCVSVEKRCDDVFFCLVEFCTLYSFIFFHHDWINSLLDVSDSVDVHVGFGHFQLVFAG